MPADDFSDLASRHALVAHAVIAHPSSTLLKCEPVEMSSVEPMYPGPAVKPIPDICGNTLFPSDTDQAWHETVITVAVDRWGKPQHRRVHSACRQRKRRFLRLTGKGRIVRILFCCDRALALNEQGTGSDD